MSDYHDKVIQELQTEIDTLKEKIHGYNEYIAELENAGLEYLAEIKTLKAQIMSMDAKSLAKETPKKVVTSSRLGCRLYCCPTCNYELWDSDLTGCVRRAWEERCPRCGQKLIWR